MRGEGCFVIGALGLGFGPTLFITFYKMSIFVCSCMVLIFAYACSLGNHGNSRHGRSFL